MYKIIGADQKEYGPISADQVRQWILEGRAGATTLAQAQGSSEWKPLAAFPEFATAFSSMAPKAEFKSAEAFEREMLARPTELRIGSCLERGWKFLIANFGFLCFATFVLGLVNIGLMCIPLLGGLAIFILRGVLFGGFYAMVLKRIRGQEPALKELFAGFAAGLFTQLMLAGVVTKLLTQIGFLFCVVPGVYLAVAWMFAVPLAADKGMDFWPAMELSRRIVNRVWFSLFGLIVILFLPTFLFNVYATIKVFSLLLPVISSGDFDIARIVALAQSAATLAFLGVAVYFLNLIFSVSTLMYAYEDLFGSRPAPAA